MTVSSLYGQHLAPRTWRVDLQKVSCELGVHDVLGWKPRSSLQAHSPPCPNTAMLVLFVWLLVSIELCSSLMIWGGGGSLEGGTRALSLTGFTLLTWKAGWTCEDLGNLKKS